MKLINNSLILIIKFYKYFISPYFPSNCRHLPTCSEYFIDCLKFNGILKEKNLIDLNYTYVIFGKNNVYKDKFTLILSEVNSAFKKINMGHYS